MMADDKPLGVALLGCGAAARLATAALRPLPAVRCHYASRDGERAAAFARELGGAASHGSYEAAIESPEIDVAFVLTPPDQHLDWTLRALEAGKHVIVEKPPFLRSTDFDVVAAAARQAGRQVMVAENYYYKPLALRLRDLLGQGAVGEPRFVYVNAVKEQRASGWRLDPAVAGGGALFEGGIHWVNLMANLGLAVAEAFGAASAPAGQERSITALFRYASGASGALLYSWEIPSPLKGLRLSRIHGTRGSIAFESNGLILFVWGARKRVVLPGLGDMTGRKAMFRDFIRAARANTEPEMNLARARRDVEIIESIYASLPRQAASGGAA
jgi:UDP-N-acetylglucosamine 3-dehydrogenase